MKFTIGYWNEGNTPFVSLDSETLDEQQFLRQIFERGVELHSFGTVLEGTGRLILQAKPIPTRPSAEFSKLTQ